MPSGSITETVDGVQRKRRGTARAKQSQAAAEVQPTDTAVEQQKPRRKYNKKTAIQQSQADAKLQLDNTVPKQNVPAEQRRQLPRVHHNGHAAKAHDQKHARPRHNRSQTQRTNNLLCDQSYKRSSRLTAYQRTHSPTVVGSNACQRRRMQWPGLWAMLVSHHLWMKDRALVWTRH